MNRARRRGARSEDEENLFFESRFIVFCHTYSTSQRHLHILKVWYGTIPTIFMIPWWWCCKCVWKTTRVVHVMQLLVATHAMAVQAVMKGVLMPAVTQSGKVKWAGAATDGLKRVEVEVGGGGWIHIWWKSISMIKKQLLLISRLTGLFHIIHP